MKRKRIFLYGDHGAAYRPSAFFKYFAVRNNEYTLTSCAGNYFDRQPSFIYKPLSLLHCLISVLSSDIIVFFPMSHGIKNSKPIILLARLFKKKIVTDFYISLYERVAIELKSHNPEDDYSQYLKRRDILAITKSDKTIFLNRSEAIYYHKAIGIAEESRKTAVVPLVGESRQCAKLPYANHSTEIPTLAWWGREGVALHGLENILRTIQILLSCPIKINFAVFGCGLPRWSQLSEEFKDVFSNPRVLTSTEYNFANGKLVEYLTNRVDLSFGILGETIRARSIIANKIIDAASFGIPTITIESEGVKEYFRDRHSIFFSEPTPEKIAETVMGVIQDRDLLLNVGLQARRVAEDSFSKQAFDRNLDELFKELN